eukprot:2044526-Pyramimonas_sp.AAC.1
MAVEEGYDRSARTRKILGAIDPPYRHLSALMLRVTCRGSSGRRWSRRRWGAPRPPRGPRRCCPRGSTRRSCPA